MQPQQIRGGRQNPQPPRRPATRLGLVGLLAHVLFELVAGVGMPLASRAGPLPADALWILTTGGLWRAAGSRRGSADRLFAVVNGVGLTAVVRI